MSLIRTRSPLKIHSPPTQSVNDRIIDEDGSATDDRWTGDFGNGGNTERDRNRHPPLFGVVHIICHLFQCKAYPRLLPETLPSLAERHPKIMENWKERRRKDPTGFEPTISRLVGWPARTLTAVQLPLLRLRLTT